MISLRQSLAATVRQKKWEMPWRIGMTCIVKHACLPLTHTSSKLLQPQHRVNTLGTATSKDCDRAHGGWACQLGEPHIAKEYSIDDYGVVNICFHECFYHSLKQDFSDIGESEQGFKRGVPAGITNHSSAHCHNDSKAVCLCQRHFPAVLWQAIRQLLQQVCQCKIHLTKDTCHVMQTDLAKAAWTAVRARDARPEVQESVCTQGLFREVRAH